MSNIVIPRIIIAIPINHGGEMTSSYSPLQKGRCHGDASDEYVAVVEALTGGRTIVNSMFSPSLPTKGTFPMLCAQGT